MLAHPYQHRRTTLDAVTLLGLLVREFAIFYLVNDRDFKSQRVVALLRLTLEFIDLPFLERKGVNPIQDGSWSQKKPEAQSFWPFLTVNSPGRCLNLYFPVFAKYGLLLKINFTAIYQPTEKSGACEIEYVKVAY